MRWRWRFPIWALAVAAACAPLGLAQSAAPPTAGGAWVFQGPQPLTDTVESYGALGGAVNALVASGAGVFAGTEGGGVWKWSGAGWQPLTDGAPAMRISALAVDAVTGKIYAGTGDVGLRDGGLAGSGLLVSTDGGNTWQTAGGTTLKGLTITGIWIDPLNSGHIIVAAVAPAGTRLPGIYESTDGATTWTEKLEGQAWALAWDASSLELYADLGGVVEQWQAESGPSAVVTDATPPASAAASFSLAANPATGSLAALGLTDNGACTGVFTRTGTGTTWTPVPCPTAQPFTAPVAMGFAPDGALWLGGAGLWRWSGSGWTQLIAPSTPGEEHALLFAAGAVWAGADGGVWELPATTSSNWIDQNSTAAAGTALGAVSLTSATAAGAGLIAATRAGGLVVPSVAPAWQTVASGNGATLAVAPSDANTVYAALPGAAGLLVSSTGGVSYQLRTWTASSGPYFPDPTLAPVKAVIAVAPDSALHVLLGTDRLWQSSDGGQSWTALQPALVNGGVVSALAIALQNASVWYEGTSAGQLFRSSDAGASWSAASGLPARAITALAVDPDPSPAAAASAPDTLVAGLGGVNAATPTTPGHLFFSTDGGASWTNISGVLPDQPVVAVALDPLDAQVIYAALSQGVYATPDRGNTWYALGSGLPNAPLAELRLAATSSSRALLLATAGRGAWTLPLGGAARAVNALAGNGQTAPVGQALPQPLVVAVSNVFGLPLAGVTVNWSDNGAGGSFSASQTVTGANGQAAATYTTPAHAGTVELAATTAQGGAAFFSATAAAGTAVSLVADAGAGQTGVAGTALASPLVAEALDAQGNPVAGVTVTFSDGGAGGSFNPAHLATDNRGWAATQYTLPTTPKPLTVTAAASGLPNATFAETATPAPDFSLRLTPASVSANVDVNTSFQLASSAITGDTRLINLICVSPATGCTVTPGAVSPGAGATVTVSTGPLALGTNTITVEGNDGLHTHQITATVNVLTPDFGVTLTAPSPNVNQIAAAALQVATTAINGSFRLISLACTAPASGCTFTPAQIAPGQSATLAIAAGTLTAGAQTVSIQANDGANTHTASATLTVVPPGLSLAISAPTFAVAAGQTGNATVSVIPTGGLTGLVALACTGLPQDAACSFQPATWTSDGVSSTSAALALVTTGNAGAQPVPARRRDGRPWRGSFAALLWAGLALLVARLAPLWDDVLRSRRVRLAAALSLLMMAAGCGGGSAAPPPAVRPPITGTPPGTYQVTVIATSGTVTAQATITLTVH